MTEVLPDPDEARRWAEQELSDPVYAASEPTLLDRVALAVGDFLRRIFDPQPGEAWSPLLAVLLVLVAAALVVAAVLIWGRPRSAHRTAARSAQLFGEDEQRSAAELRMAAERSAAAEDWDAAIADRFRALARGIDERGLVSAPPGTTAQRLARAAAVPFPAHATALSAAAGAFDDVRYLRRHGTAETYAVVARLDDEIAISRPSRMPEGAPT